MERFLARQRIQREKKEEGIRDLFPLLGERLGKKKALCRAQEIPPFSVQFMLALPEGVLIARLKARSDSVTAAGIICEKEREKQRFRPVAARLSLFPNLTLLQSVDAKECLRTKKRGGNDCGV